MTFSTFRKSLPICLACLVVLTSSSAFGQDAAGQIFNQIFNVGGVGDRQGTNFDGSVGCGATGVGAGGSQLTDALGFSPLLGTTQDRDFSNAGQRDRARDIWRLCDNLYAQGGAWTLLDITPEAEHLQSEGMAPDELFSQVRNAAAVTDLQLGNISQRISSLRTVHRAGGDGIQLASAPRMSFASNSPQVAAAASLNLASLLQSGLSVTDDQLAVRGLGVFINGRYNHLESDSTPDEGGTEGDGGGVTVGVDYFFTDDAYLGLSFGYTHFSADFDNNLGENKVDDYAFNAYGSYFIGDTFYIDGVFGGSILRYDQEKVVPTFDAASPFEALDSDPNGWTLAGDIGVGADFPISRLSISSYVRVAFLHTRVDDFDERGGDGSLAFSIDDQENTSVTSVVGLSGSLPVSTGFGVVSPYLRVEWVHEYMDQADNLKGFLIVIPEAKFELKPRSVDRDYVNFGGGISTVLKDGISVFVDYDGLFFYKNLESHQVTLGGRLAF